MRKQVYTDGRMIKNLRAAGRFCRKGRKLAVLFLLMTVFAAAGCKAPGGQQPTDDTQKEEAKKDSTQPTDATEKSEDGKDENLEKDSVRPTDTTVKKDAEGGGMQSEEKNAKPYYGKWKIVSGIPGQYSAMSQEEIQAKRGTIFEYYEEYAAYGAEKLEKPVYQETTVSKAEFAELYQGSSFETLGIVKDVIDSITIEDALDLGSTFYVKDENTLITVWDGVFFEMERSGLE